MSRNRFEGAASEPTAEQKERMRDQAKARFLADPKFTVNNYGRSSFIVYQTTNGTKGFIIYDYNGNRQDTGVVSNGNLTFLDN